MTGIGAVHGRLVAFAANDATVRGGTYYPITVKVPRVTQCRLIAEESSYYVRPEVDLLW